IAAIALFVVDQVASRRGFSLPPKSIVFAFGIGITWTVIQSIPLPCSVVRQFAPQTAIHAERSAEAIGAEAQCAISQDPGRTREEIIKGLALFCFFVMASLLGGFTDDDGYEIVGGACFALALSAIGHALLDAQAVWGIYFPRSGQATWGPFVNPNHLGGLMALGAPTAFGLALRRFRSEQRAFWAVAGATMLAVLAFSRSRGAIAAGLSGLALLGWTAARLRNPAHKREQPRFFENPLVLTMVFVSGGAVVMGVTAGLDEISREFESADLKKIELIIDALKEAWNAPWTGLGRGAFGVAYLEHVQEGVVRFEYAENFVAQWLSEWGLPVGGIVIVLLGRGLIESIKGVRRMASAGAAAGLLAYIVQNLVDFGMESLGSASVAAALLGSLSTRSRRRQEQTISPRLGRWPSALSLITLIAVTALGASVVKARVENLEDRLMAEIQGGRRWVWEEVLREGVLAHPRQPSLFLWGAVGRAREGDLSVFRLLNRAMELAPSWAGPHLLASQILENLGKSDQAILEMREALERSPFVAGQACRLLALHPSAENLMRMAPRNKNRKELIVALITCLPLDFPGAEESDRKLIEQNPGLVEPYLRLAERALRRKEVRKAFEILPKAKPDEDPRITLLRARAAFADGNLALATSEVKKAEERLEDPWPAVELRARIAAASGNWEAMRDAVSDLRGLAGSRVDRLAEADVLLGQMEAQGGNYGRALAAFESAWRSFERIDALVEVARLAERFGDKERLKAAEGTLCARGIQEYCEKQE
ncbi:MAG: hypothetical protein NZM37_02850, partial [Sandaracinaceae bacterium]|nr:hypothetical protein [Sandaracinaceae bacterium]